MLSTPPAEMAAQIQSLLNIEAAAASKETIATLCRSLLSKKEDFNLFLPESLFNYVVYAKLEEMDVEFDRPALSSIVLSLSNERHHAPFYGSLFESDDYRSLLHEQKVREQAEYASYIREQEYRELEERSRVLEARVDYLLRRLGRDRP